MYGALARAEQPDYSENIRMGSSLAGDLVGAIAKWQQQRKANALANQLMNIEAPPRAGLVNLGIDPTTGKPGVLEPGASPVGTAPATGGTEQLSLQDELVKRAQARINTNLINQLNQAKIADYLAKVQGTGHYAPRTALTPAQQINQTFKQQQAEIKQQQAELKRAQSEAEKNADSPERLQKDFDAIYGKGSGENFFNALITNSGVRGNLVNGQFVPNESGDYYTYNPDAAQGALTQEAKKGFLGLGAAPEVRRHLMASELKGALIPYGQLQPYLDRLTAIQKGGGGKVTPTVVARALPVSPVSRQPLVSPGAVSGGGATDGSDVSAEEAANLPRPTTQEEFDNLPSRTILVDGDEKIKIKP
jgi:hypothetical protein